MAKQKILMTNLLGKRVVVTGGAVGDTQEERVKQAKAWGDMVRASKYGMAQGTLGKVCGLEFVVAAVHRAEKTVLVLQDEDGQLFDDVPVDWCAVIDSARVPIAWEKGTGK